MAPEIARVAYDKCHPEQCDGGICAAARACSRRLLWQEAPGEIPVTDPTLCQGCGDCGRACPAEAIQIVARRSLSVIDKMG